eukprot:6120643-Pleurochrysis_carterae.AAC.1
MTINRSFENASNLTGLLVFPPSNDTLTLRGHAFVNTGLSGDLYLARSVRVFELEVGFSVCEFSTRFLESAKDDAELRLY